MAKITFTDDTFAQDVEGEKEKPVLGDFWAEWCGPCRVQRPVVGEVADEMADSAKVGELDVDANPKHAQKYGIMSIPTIAIFKEGKIVWQAVGVQDKQTLLDELKKAAA